MNEHHASLSSSLQIGLVELNVENLRVQKDFYHNHMGLDILSESKEKIVLGFNQTPLLVLHHAAHLVRAKISEAGLYHFAILFSSRGDLARVLHRMFRSKPESFTGSGDHLVSEAFYFNDPEGNGIELYFDRDSSTWSWKDNQVQMAALYIDPKEYLERYLVLEEENTQVRMGHIHLKVGDVDLAKRFYIDILGFSITAQLPHALFISVAGYHHHLGINSWESYGAAERTDTLGLKKFELKLAGLQDIERLKQRLSLHKVHFTQKNNDITFQDPWKNEITVSFLE